MNTKITYALLVSEIGLNLRGTYEHAAMIAIVASEDVRSPIIDRVEAELTPAQAKLMKIGWECDDLAKALRRAALEAAERVTIFAERLVEERGADYMPDDPTGGSAFARVTEIRSQLKELRRTFAIVAELALDRVALARLGAAIREASAIRSLGEVPRS